MNWNSFLSKGIAASLVICGSVSVCFYAEAGELIKNGGFEDGVYTANGNPYVPNDWNAAPSFMDATGDVDAAGVYGTPRSGTSDLSIGNYDYQNDPAVLSQTFSTKFGATYSGSFYIYYGQTDSQAFFDASVDGANLVTLNDAVGGSYVKETFSFVGTGSDTLTFTAQTNPAEWIVDDVSVTGDVSPVPLPASAPLFGAALLALGAVGYGLKRKGIATA